MSLYKYKNVFFIHVLEISFSINYDHFYLVNGFGPLKPTLSVS